MFDFENLKVYQRARDLNSRVVHLMRKEDFDRVSSYQLRRASLSVMLNIAEGSGRFSSKDKRRFYIMSRGSLFECVAILDFLCMNKMINEETKGKFYSDFETLSKMLLATIRSLE